jgi:tetratricopeptide (TPR) repeat protein
MLAPTDAGRLFADALELVGDEETAERCAALIGLGAAKHQSGDRSYRETLLEASQIAYRLRDADLAAQAALTNSRGSYSLIGEVDFELVEAIERALELDDPPLPARRARLLALEAQELEWGSDLERRRALADEAVRLARQSGDERALGDVLLNAYYAYWTPLTHDTQVGLARELTVSAASAEDPGLAFWTHVMNLNIALEASDEPSVTRTLGEIMATADALRQPIPSWVAAYNLAGWALLHERLPTAGHLVEQAFELGQQAGEPDAVFIYGAQLASLRTYQGRGEEILGMIEQSVANMPDFAGWHAALAHVYGLLGRTDEAAAIVRDAAAKDFKHVASDQTATCAFAMYADAAACADLPDAAEKLYALIEPWSERFVWNGAVGFGHGRMWLGILACTLGHHQLADEHMAHACDVQERGGSVLWTTYAHLRWGEALAARGEAERAHEHARRAFALASDYGYGAFEGRAGALASSMAPA